MRVLHVVSVFSSDGSSGGPVQVARAHLAALTAAGVSVDLVGAAAKAERRKFGGPRVRLFPLWNLPLLGTAGTFSPRLLLWLLRNARNYDVVHVHLSRDLVTLPAALVAVRRAPLVIQTHGMVDSSDKPLAKIVDKLATVRVLRSAKRVLALTSVECADLEIVAGRLNSIDILGNSVEFPSIEVARVTDPPEIVFLARLHQRKRPELFTRMAVELLRRGYSANFHLVGPDEGALADAMRWVSDSGYGAHVVWEGAIDRSEVFDRLSRAYLYVLPAEREPFGLTVVEALAVGTPVVLADDAALAPTIVAADCGSVFDGSVEALSSVVSSYLDDPCKRARQASKARTTAASQFSDGDVATRLGTIYAKAIGET